MDGREIAGQLDLFPGPQGRCRADWRCSVCNASADALGWDKRYTENTMRCGVCGMPYAYPFIRPGSKKRYTPKPAYDANWRRVWRRAWRYYGMSNLVIVFMGEFTSWQDANNAMNRLDGGALKTSASQSNPEEVTGRE